MKRYLIYLDILGYEKLAKKIAKEKAIKENKIRSEFINTIKEKIRIIESRKLTAGEHYKGTDDWLLITDSLDNVFRIILEILDHNTGHEDYDRIPLEIGVGKAEFDKGTNLNGENLVTQNETIKFLKTPILDYYRRWHRDNKGQRITSTFIIFTEGAYQELEPRS